MGSICIHSRQSTCCSDARDEQFVYKNKSRLLEIQTAQGNDFHACQFASKFTNL